MLLVKQPRITLCNLCHEGQAGVFCPFTLCNLILFNSPSFSQYIKTPPSPFQPLKPTWQRSRTQAEHAAPSLSSAIQTFQFFPLLFCFFLLKTHNKRQMRELAYDLVSAETMEIYSIHLCAALQPGRWNDTAIAPQGFAWNMPRRLVQHKHAAQNAFKGCNYADSQPNRQEAKPCWRHTFKDASCDVGVSRYAPRNLDLLLWYSTLWLRHAKVKLVRKSLVRMQGYSYKRGRKRVAYNTRNVSFYQFVERSLWLARVR